MTYIPEVHDTDELEEDFGTSHALFNWNIDYELREKWPTRKYCKENEWNHKVTLATYHWAAVSGRPLSAYRMSISESWKHPMWLFYPDDKTQFPIVFLRVHCIQRLSQYMGWLDLRSFYHIPVINFRFPGERGEVKRMRRVILNHQLKRGLPEDTEFQATLFEK